MSAQGTTPRRIRIDDDLWSRFGEAIASVDAELDRSRVIRNFVRWYVGDTEAFPVRPEPSPQPAGERPEETGP